jgi:drug/metabolite transporter (DMT)-like permease
VNKPSLAPYAWMLCGCFSFAWMAEFASHLGQLGCDWRITVLARSGLVFLFALGLARLAGARLVLWKPPVLWMRSIVGSVSMLCTFFAFNRLRSSCEVLTLTNTFPIWVALLSWPLLRLRPSLSVWLAAGCGVAGVVLIQLPHLESESFGDWLAAPLALTAAFTSAIAMLGLNRLKDLHPWAIVVHFSGVATVFAIASWFVGEAVPVEQIARPDVAMLLLGVAVTATFGQMCLTRAFTAGDPAKVSIVCLTQILFAFGLHWMFGGETLARTTLAGIALVMAPTAWVMAGKSAE